MNNDLISRSVLTERIVDLLVFHWGYEGVEADVKQIFSEIPAVDAGPKWISVEDRLPERNKRVLVAFKSGMVTTSMRTLEQHTGVFGFLFEGDYGTATHWMPLPEPPEVPHG